MLTAQENTQVKANGKSASLPLDPLRALAGNSVAIVGFAPSTREKAPWDDAEGWGELWLCNRGTLQPWAKRWTRHFDPHPLQWSEQHFSAELWREYLEWMTRDHGERLIYLLDRAESIPNSVAYPMEKVLAFVKRRYFTSAIAYQIALALMLGAKRIGLWGIDLSHDEEYGTQRPNAEWLLGLAQGMGVEIVIPEESAVLNANRHEPLYGAEEGSADMIEVERALVTLKKEFEVKIEQQRAKNSEIYDQLHAATGATMMLDELIRRTRRKRRGGVF